VTQARSSTPAPYLVPSDRPWFRYWPEGVPRHIDYPPQPLPYLLESSAERFGSKTAFKTPDSSITYSRLKQDSDRFATSLRALGMEKGDRLLLLLPNTIEFVVSFYGALKAGCVLATVNHLAKRDEIARVLGEIDPRAAVISSGLGSDEVSVLKASGLKILAAGSSCPRDIISFSQFVSGAPGSLSAPGKTDAPAVIQYTGSTTGAPKPVVMSNRNLLANAVQNAAWFSWDNRTTVIGVLPLCHTWGCSCCMNSPIHAGATTILLERFEPEVVLQTIERERATVLYGSATMFSLLLAHPGLEEFDLSSLRFAKAGAMPVPIELKRRWDRKTGVEMTLGYGLTEASPETHDCPPGRTKPGTIGIPIVDTDARVVDLGTGKDVPAGRSGELLVRGPQVTSLGYLNDPEGTAKILGDSWLRTGDIAVMDTEGYFTLIDRKKDIIKCKGNTIYPVELEEVLYGHPAVKECAVVGKRHPEYGEIPKAFVVPEDGAELTPGDIVSFCEGRVSPPKRIREAEIVSQIPKTHVGKVLRRKLRGTE